MVDLCLMEISTRNMKQCGPIIYTSLYIIKDDKSEENTEAEN